ncbi:polysaccharide lyase family 8 super-sandwich domain-containing protein [Paenibacillus sp. 1P03SA]|uniref:polysaccharide lyase family 8 super-sandwich domain-containing protein n=1 Tax=Paenibacillus sp. 1P03SA TaxID=3132294 RepID=UPI0039A10C8B
MYRLTKTSYLAVILCFSLVFTLFGAGTRPVRAEDAYDGMRLKLLHLILGDDQYSLPVSDPLLQDKLAKMDSAVSSCAAASAPCSSGKGMWDILNRGADRTYLWIDLPFTSTDSYTKSGDITNSYNRLLSMITAYYTPGSSFYGNAALKNDVLSALDWLYTQKYNTSVTPYGNWYHWQIGVPQALTKIGILMRDDLSAVRLTNYMNAVNRFIPDSAARTVSGSPVMTGANLLDQAVSVAYRGILVKDAAKITNARDALGSVFAYVNPASAPNTPARDGFYQDGSFIQHAAMPYIGGYGTTLLNDIGILLYTLQGTQWDVTDAGKWNVYKWVFDSVEPFIYDGNVMDMVRGRNIAYGPALGNTDSGPVLTGKGLIASIGYLLLTAPSTNEQMGEKYPDNPKQAIQGMLKYWLSKDTTNQILDSSSMYQYFQLKQIANSPVPSRGEKTGTSIYANQDRAVHLRPGFGFGLSLSSNRVDKYESGNKNNVQGWYTGDGMTYLYNADSGQYDNFWPTVNRYRLPGTTVDTQTRTNSSNWTSYLSPNRWAGGAELLGTYGAAGMDLKSPGDIGSGGAILTPSNLTAKKSWFMFDDEIVSLGAGITNSGQTGSGWDSSPRKVETIVENRKIAGGNEFAVNGTAQPAASGWSSALPGTNWAYLQGNTGGESSSTGYYFPGSAALKASRETRTGSWNEINEATPGVYNVMGTEDSYVRSNEGNHGAEPTVVVKNDANGYARETYLKFDLTNFVPGQVKFDSAKVTLVPTAIGPTAKAVQHTAEWVPDNSWTETGLLWTNKPVSSPLSPVQQWSGMQAGTPVTIDVSQALQNALANNRKVFSLRIYASSPADPDGTVAYASRENPNASYRPKLVLSGYKEMKSADYLTLWMDHGVNPSNASYSYVTLPNRSRAQVQGYAANPDIAILENTTAVQAVKEKTLNLTAANFWQDGIKTVKADGTDFLTVDKKASVLVKESADGLDVSVSDPTQQNSGTIQVEINRSYSGAVFLEPGIGVIQSSPTLKLSVDVNGSYGRTFRAKFSNAAAVTLPAKGDATVRDGSYAGTNYGTAGFMEVKNEAVSYNRSALVQFDLSSYTGAAGRAAIVLMPIDSPAKAVTHQARLVSAQWDEKSLTWSTKPVPGLPLAEWKVPAAGSPVMIDVSEAVQRALASGDKRIAVEIRSLTNGSDTYASYASKENAAAASRPVLKITAP